jgi:hypothetical protein
MIGIGLILPVKAVRTLRRRPPTRVGLIEGIDIDSRFPGNVAPYPAFPRFVEGRFWQEGSTTARPFSAMAADRQASSARSNGLLRSVRGRPLARTTEQC